MINLDSFDLAILRILQEDNITPQREISELVNLSPASVQRRIKRIQKSGLILGNSSIIDPLKLGNYITVIVEVVLEKETKNLIEEAKKVFKAYDEVQQCYYVTGEVDFILILLVDSISRYEELTKQMFFDNQNVKRFNTFITLERVKVGLKIKV